MGEILGGWFSGLEEKGMGEQGGDGYSTTKGGQALDPVRTVGGFEAIKKRQA